MGTVRTESLYFWSDFDPPFIPEDGQNKKQYLPGKTLVTGLSKYDKNKALSPPLFPGKI